MNRQLKRSRTDRRNTTRDKNDSEYDRYNSLLGSRKKAKRNKHRATRRSVKAELRE